MPILIPRLLSLARTKLTGWRLPLALSLWVFLTSWLLMALAEPASNEITRPENYWWWFLVTAATVGYGDFFPETLAGHVVGGYVIIGGIVTLTILFTQMSNAVQTAKGKRMKGSVGLTVSGHTVLLGYLPGRTEKIVAELAVEERPSLVLCAWDDVPEHPMPERTTVQFIRGDLTHADVMRRACVAQADTVIVDGRDDNETLAIAVAVNHANPDVHLVAAVRDMSRCDNMRYVTPRVQCVQWHQPYMITEEALDPGITQVYTDLMTGGGHGNTYSMALPDHAGVSTVGDCQMRLGREFAATLLAVRRDGELQVSPPWDAELPSGATLYYVAAERIEPRSFAAAAARAR